MQKTCGDRVGPGCIRRPGSYTSLLHGASAQSQFPAALQVERIASLFPTYPFYTPFSTQLAL